MTFDDSDIQTLAEQYIGSHNLYEIYDECKLKAKADLRVDSHAMVILQKVVVLVGRMEPALEKEVLECFQVSDHHHHKW